MKPFKGSKEGNTILSEEQQRKLAMKIIKNQKRDLADLVTEYIGSQQQRYEFYNKSGKRSEIRGILGFELMGEGFGGHRNSVIADEIFIERARLILQRTKREIEETLNITWSYRSKLEGREGGFGDNRGLIDYFCQRSPINSTQMVFSSMNQEEPIAGVITKHGVDKNGAAYVIILLGEALNGQRFTSKCYINEKDEGSPLLIELRIQKLNDNVLGVVVPCRIVKAEANAHKKGLWIITKLMYHRSKHTHIY